jgi:uncharacterized membrane protein YfcA
VSLLEVALTLFVACIAAGLLGSLVGLGGGIVVVPLLTLVYHVDIRIAIGASIISTIATSSGAAAAYVKEGISNIRVGLFLEIGTTLGAITGAYIAGLVSIRILYLLFGVVLAVSAYQMIRGGYHDRKLASNSTDVWADKLRLHDSFYDRGTQTTVAYKVANTKLGLGLMYVAGAVSGLLGIGSGALKVPAMDLAMHLPMKVSSATSNFMIGVTAAASAGIYFLRGDVNPFIAGPTALGVVIGALLGARLLPKMDASKLRGIFVVILVIVALQMLYKGAV